MYILLVIYTHKYAGKEENLLNVFGPYCLRTYPQKQAFKAKFPLRFDQQCLLDNLFHQPKTAQYSDILHALVGHLANLNSQIEKSQNHFPLLATHDTPEPVFTPLWQEKERMLDIENKSKNLQIFELEKELQVYRKKMAEFDLLKSAWEKELKNKKEYLEVFPKELDEVKEKIRSIVIHDNKCKLLATQECLRNMTRAKKVPFKGLALHVLGFQGDKHPQYYCKCTKGFNFVQASIDLRSWQDVDSFISFKNLFQSGMIKRVTLTTPRQVVTHIEPLSWRLAHIQMFKLDLVNKGYINLDFESIPSSLKFPDAARHSILITTHEFKIPVQHPLQDSFSLMEGEVEDHYTLARVYLQASQPLVLHLPRYDFQLLSEDCNIKIYGNPCLHRRFFDVPFLNHITEDVSFMFHLQAMNQQQLSSNYGNFLDSYDDITSLSLDAVLAMDQRDTDNMIEV